MRPPWVVNVAQAGEFDEIIDVRSPAEFDLDHIPGAINCPVLDNDERARVGTIYTQVSTFEARKMGAAYMARNIARHLEQRFQSHSKSWRPLVYCWRGGNRSGAMAQVLAQVGWPASQLQGGYRAYRRAVVAELATLPANFQYRVILGETGTGKSRLLQALDTCGAQVLDLEQLAAHRGSVLGDVPNALQPSQKMFESLILARLKKFDAGKPVTVEAESKKIGLVQVPESLLGSMRAAPCLRLQTGMELRVELLKQDYAHYFDDPEGFCRQLSQLSERHGKQKIAHWQALARAGRADQLVAELLAEHYDPAYRKSMLKHYARYREARVLMVNHTGASAMRELARASLSEANMLSAVA